MKPYRYACVDESILLPYLKKYVFVVLHRIVPYGVPANYLTVVSIIIMWTAFTYFVTIEEVNSEAVLVAIFAILLYVIFDHFDGLQAKASQTSSPLGEILDHYSDVFNGAIVVYLCFRCMHLQLGWLFLIVLWFNFLAFAVTYVEQRERRELYFGKIGSLEGIILILLVMLSCLSFAGLDVWHQPGLFSQPNYLLLFTVFLLGFLFTAYGCIDRIGHCPADFLHFSVAGTVLMLICGAYSIPWYLASLVITGYSSDYILNSMQTYFFGVSSRHPDPVLLLLLAGVALLQLVSWNVTLLIIIFWIYGLLIAGKIFWRGRNMWQELKVFWIWWNER